MNISDSGIVFRPDEGDVVVVVPDRNGGSAQVREVDQAFAEQYRLNTGDVVRGSADAATIDGLSLDEALDRPLPRPKRNSLERSSPAERIVLSNGPTDITGRALDFAASLGRGMAGLIYGSHGSGLTHSLRSVVHGAGSRGRELEVIVLLTNPRSEEITDWRRRFPTADIVVCPLAQFGATGEETLLVADLVLACAQRQTELGRHVLLAVDSLTGLWAAMLETEEADAQREADRAGARQRIREWIQCAGEFGGEGLLGSGLGGSLTVVGAAWHQSVNVEAEEEGETHPHLRLIEHVLNETAWRVALSGRLAGRRLFPAIDLPRCLSASEETLLDSHHVERLAAARRTLLDLPDVDRIEKLMEAIAETGTETELCEALAPVSGEEDAAVAEDEGDFWKGLKMDGV